MLELLEIHTYYGESHILHGVSLTVTKAAIVSLLGRNGMGKTTTVRTIIGFTPPRSGIVRFKGKDVQGLPAHKISRMGLGLVPQGRRLSPSLSVEENLLIGARGQGWSFERVYSLFPILRTRAKHKGNFLSGGEQQMACIARALLTNPDFLLMDEPSEGLAPLLVREVGRIISQLKGEGLSILLIEQNVPLALRVSNYAYILYHGQIVHHCSAQELAGNQQVQSEYIGVTRRSKPNALLHRLSI
jgi:branched-chain amino acid transport system ATP-binding protein